MSSRSCCLWPGVQAFGARTLRDDDGYPAFRGPRRLAEHILVVFAALTLIIARGPGVFSLDYLIWNNRLSVPAIAHRAQA